MPIIMAVSDLQDKRWPFSPWYDGADNQVAMKESLRYKGLIVRERQGA